MCPYPFCICFLLAGYVAKDTIPAGMHLKTLFASSHFFSLKTQLAEMTQDAPTNEGLIVELDGAMRPQSLWLRAEAVAGATHHHSSTAPVACPA